MIEKMDLLMLNSLAMMECKMLDEILSNPNLSDDEIKNLLLAIRSISNEINNKITTITNKS